MTYALKRIRNFIEFIVIPAKRFLWQIPTFAPISKVEIVSTFFEKIIFCIPTNCYRSINGIRKEFLVSTGTFDRQ